MKTEIKPATREMLTEMYGHPPSRSMRAYAGFADGQLLAVFGWYYVNDDAVLFSKMKPEARKYKKTLVKAARMVVNAAKVRLKAIPDCDVPGSEKLLAHLGFRKVGHAWSI